jgi:hypothetical protein
MSAASAVDFKSKSNSDCTDATATPAATAASVQTKQKSAANATTEHELLAIKAARDLELDGLARRIQTLEMAKVELEHQKSRVWFEAAAKLNLLLGRDVVRTALDVIDAVLEKLATNGKTVFLFDLDDATHSPFLYKGGNQLEFMSCFEPTPELTAALRRLNAKLKPRFEARVIRKYSVNRDMNGLNAEYKGETVDWDEFPMRYANFNFDVTTAHADRGSAGDVSFTDLRDLPADGYVRESVGDLICREKTNDIIVLVPRD